MNFSTQNNSGNIPGGVKSKQISTRVLQPPGGASSWSVSNQFGETPSASQQYRQHHQQHYTQAGAEIARRAASEQHQFTQKQHHQRPVAT